MIGKKIFAALLVIVLTLGCASVSAYAGENGGQVVFPEGSTDFTLHDGWLYFRAPHARAGEDHFYTTPMSIYRVKANGTGKQLISAEDDLYCNRYELYRGLLYYHEGNPNNRNFDRLRRCEPDGTQNTVLVEFAQEFQIVGDYIYYDVHTSTTGPGLINNSLHRIDLDGSNDIIAAYHVFFTWSKLDETNHRMSSYRQYNLPKKDKDNHYSFDLGDEWYVEGEWCYYGDYRIKLDGPATGWETVQLYQQIPGVTDDAYIYYITNRLIKAKPDGSGQVELDGATDFYIDIWKDEDGWVYYQKNNMSYRIRTDGSIREVRE